MTWREWLLKLVEEHKETGFVSIEEFKKLLPQEVSQLALKGLYEFYISFKEG